MRRVYYYIINCRLFIFIKNLFYYFTNFIINIYNIFINFIKKYKLNRFKFVSNIKKIINLILIGYFKLGLLFNILYDKLIYIYNIYKSYILQYFIIFIFFLFNIFNSYSFLLYNLFFFFFIIFILYFDIFKFNHYRDEDFYFIPELSINDQIKLIFELKDNGLMEFFEIEDDSFIMDDLNKMENLLLIGRKNIINDVFLESNYKRIINQVNEEKRLKENYGINITDKYSSTDSCNLNGICNMQTDKELYIKNFDDFRDLRSSYFMDNFDKIFFLKLSILITDKEQIDELFNIKENYSSKDLKPNDFTLKYYMNAKILMYYDYMFNKSCINNINCKISINNFSYNDFIKTVTNSKFFNSYDNIKDYNDVSLYLFNTDTNISILFKFKLFLDNFFKNDLNFNSNNIEEVYRTVFWSRTYKLNYYDEIANFYRKNQEVNPYLYNESVRNTIDMLKDYYSFSNATTNTINNIANLSLVDHTIKTQNLNTFDYTLKEDLIEHINTYNGLNLRIDNLKNSKLPYLYMNKDLTSDINYNDFEFLKVMLNYKNNVESEDFLINIQNLIEFTNNRNKINYKFINYLSDMYNKFFEININNTDDIFKYLNYRSGLVNLNSKLLNIDFYDLKDFNSYPELWFSDYRDYIEFLSNNEIINDKIKSLNKLIELNYILAYLDTEEVKGMYWMNAYINYIKALFYNNINLNDTYLNLLFYDCFRFYFYENLNDKNLLNKIDFNILDYSLFYVKPIVDTTKSLSDYELDRFEALNKNYNESYYKNEYSILKSFFKGRDMTQAENINTLENEILLNKNYKFIEKIPNINNYYLLRLDDFKGFTLNNKKWIFIRFFDSLHNPFELWEKLYFFNSNMDNKFKLKKLEMIFSVMDNIDYLMYITDSTEKNNSCNIDYNKLYNNYLGLNNTFCSYINKLTEKIYNKMSNNLNEKIDDKNSLKVNEDINIFLLGTKRNNKENMEKIHSIEYEFFNYKDLNLIQHIFENIFNLNYLKFNFEILNNFINSVINFFNMIIDFFYMIIYKIADMLYIIYYFLEPLLFLLSNLIRNSKFYKIFENFINYIKLNLNSFIDYIYSINYRYIIFLDNYKFIITIILIYIYIYLFFIYKNIYIYNIIKKLEEVVISKILKKSYITPKNKQYILNIIVKFTDKWSKLNNLKFNNREFLYFYIFNLIKINIKNINIFINIIKVKTIIFYMWINKKYCYNFINNIVYYFNLNLKNITWFIINKNSSIYSYYINSRKNFKKNKNENFKNLKY